MPVTRRVRIILIALTGGISQGHLHVISICAGNQILRAVHSEFTFERQLEFSTDFLAK
jgi:hypothetical protein